jgi:SAM-dependent methyltransferase
MRILDLGCGTGGVSLLAAEVVGPSGVVVGIDQSADAIAMAKECHRIVLIWRIALAMSAQIDRNDPMRLADSDWPICADVPALAGRVHSCRESPCTTWWGRRFS